jgi:hypothetical protein
MAGARLCARGARRRLRLDVARVAAAMRAGNAEQLDSGGDAKRAGGVDQLHCVGAFPLRCR